MRDRNLNKTESISRDRNLLKPWKSLIQMSLSRPKKKFII